MANTTTVIKTNRNQFIITIPLYLIEFLNIEKGDRFKWIISRTSHKNRLIIERVK
jgi:bifunctional DNA-binding transcriptional regulator/antitoxin component of YhaV-PrlF toxin-antitoxin module